MTSTVAAIQVVYSCALKPCTAFALAQQHAVTVVHEKVSIASLLLITSYDKPCAWRLASVNPRTLAQMTATSLPRHADSDPIANANGALQALQYLLQYYSIRILMPLRFF